MDFRKLQLLMDQGTHNMKSGLHSCCRTKIVYETNNSWTSTLTNCECYLRQVNRCYNN